MNITLNGTDDGNLIAFSNCPVIIDIDSPDTSNQHSSLSIVYNGGTITNITNQYILINNEYYIYATDTIDKAKGNYFYINSKTSDDAKVYVANSIVKALKSINFLNVNYDIFLQKQGTKLTSEVVIRAKRSGSQYDLTYSTSIPTSNVSFSKVSGSNSNNSATMNVDVYVADEYVATLSKNFVERMQFDLSNILSSQLKDYDTEIINASAVVYSTTSGGSAYTQKIFDKLQFVDGYNINQGGMFLSKLEKNIILNVKRGSTKTTWNNTILYVYEDSIPLTIYTSSSVQSSITVRYLNSAFQQISETQKTFVFNNTYTTVDIPLDNSIDYSYVDLFVVGFNTLPLRFNRIKTIKSVEDEYQRIYWRNSFGGVSFFDFVGGKTEKRDVEYATYQKNINDIYSTDKNEKIKVADKTTEIEVTLKTHLIERDAQWYLFDLQSSRKAWTYVNGVKYYIIVDDMKITEEQKGIYTAEVTYTYSLAYDY